MPIYEYLCEGCAYKFEVKQSIKDEPLATCARCGKAVKRLISSPAIMFKGSGWYVTDYSDKLKPPTSNGDAAPAKTEEKKETPSGAQPAPAAAPASSAPAANSTASTTGPSSSPSTTTTSSS